MAKKKASKKVAKRGTRVAAQVTDGMKDPLIFIDTNVLLDFYRARNDLGLAMLQKIDVARGKIITTYQVEMEFKKNRQAAFGESLSGLKIDGTIVSPAYLVNHRSVRAARKDIESAKNRIQNAISSHKSAFENPTSHDKVYQVCQRLFRREEPIILSRDSEDRKRIRRLAWKRFVLGYPPKKKNDTSIGDAINWEWLVQVATSRSCDIIIVSRDSDYGFMFDKEAYINDWLFQEFRDRVGKKRKVKLTQRLADALRGIDQPVSEEESDAEQEIISTSLLKRSVPDAMLGGSGIESARNRDLTDEYLRLVKKLSQVFEGKRGGEENPIDGI